MKSDFNIIMSYTIPLMAEIQITHLKETSDLLWIIPLS